MDEVSSAVVVSINGGRYNALTTIENAQLGAEPSFTSLPSGPGVPVTETPDREVAMRSLISIERRFRAQGANWNQVWTLRGGQSVRLK